MHSSQRAKQGYRKQLNIVDIRIYIEMENIM